MTLGPFRIALAVAAVATLVTTPLVARAQAPTFLNSWPSTGLPLGLAVDGASQVYVTDESNPWYRKFDLAGNALATVPGGFEEYGVMFCANGTLLVSSYYGCGVLRFDAAGNQIASWSTGGIRALNLAEDTAQNIYVTDDEGDRVRKFSSTGTLLNQWTVPHPSGVAYYAGRIYVAGMWSGTIRVYDTDGVLQSSFPTGATWAEQLTVDPQGHLYLADHGTKRLLSFETDGTLRWSLGPTVPGYGFGPVDVFSVALVGDGSLVVGDFEHRRVLVLREAPVPAVPMTWGVVKDRYRQ